jgi:hypothetical protein
MHVCKKIGRVLVRNAIRRTAVRRKPVFQSRYPGGDGLAYSTDTQPNPCLSLEFPHNANGVWLPPTVPGIAQGLFDVPTGGFEAGGKMYVFFVIGHLPKPPPQSLGRSVLAQSSDGGGHFSQVYTASQSKFVNLSRSTHR